MKIFKRLIQKNIEDRVGKGSLIVIYGPRQAGKTTLSKNIIKKYKEEGAYYDCQEEYVRREFIMGEPDRLLQFVRGKKIIIFDEAQTIINIGTILKVFHDKYKKLGVQIIATGSSSFDLANKIVEPMTGRAVEFTLLPLSLSEVENSGTQYNKKDLKDYLLYGMYPEIVAAKNKQEKLLALKKIANNYLYKDIFILESIKRSQAFENILRMLAFQNGQIVNTNEIAKSVGVNRATVDKYISLLEQAFIIKKITPFSGNLRNEIKKAYKVYFLDNGIRNTLTDILDDDLENRSDKVAIFENFVFSELVKKEQDKIFPNKLFFWRTKQGLEIDFVEQEGKKLYLTECKYGGDENYRFNLFLKEYGENVIDKKVTSFNSLLIK